MTMGFTVFGVLLVLLVGATVLLSLLPSQDAPSGLGEQLPSILCSLARLDVIGDITQPCICICRVENNAPPHNRAGTPEAQLSSGKVNGEPGIDYSNTGVS